MSELRDLSRLPEDQNYWDDLEARIMAELGPRVTAARQSGLWAPLAARAWLLGALACAAGLATLLLVPARSPSVGMNALGFLRPPDDSTFSAFVAAPAPPALVSLMFPSSEEQHR